MTISLYRRLLGDQFDLLPGSLRRFHDASGGGRATGTMRVERAKGWLRNLVANLMGFPKADPNVPVTLQVVVEGDRERWIRHFRDQGLETTQWAKGDLLMESVGLASFSCALVCENNGLRYDFRRAWLLGIPLPRWMAPSVEGTAIGNDVGWHVSNRIFMPLLGEIVRYEGDVEPTNDPI